MQSSLGLIPGKGTLENQDWFYYVSIFYAYSGRKKNSKEIYSILVCCKLAKLSYVTIARWRR